jgi:hypothetical protein
MTTTTKTADDYNKDEERQRRPLKTTAINGEIEDSDNDDDRSQPQRCPTVDNQHLHNVLPPNDLDYRTINEKKNDISIPARPPQYSSFTTLETHSTFTDYSLMWH